MLHFFRKYQRFFFIVITVVIVISFSFFGTYSTLNTPMPEDTEAFTAVDGSTVKRSEVEGMSQFLMTDILDKVLVRGMWGPNFLNDGVIQKDFLETGLGAVLANEYRDLLEPDFSLRQKKEKNYRLYKHPQADFLSVDTVWNYVAPEMKGYFKILKEGNNPLSEVEFDARVQLYLAERRLPAPMVRQFLNYQKQQYPWLKDDHQLEQTDLALFGYHDIEGWFGPKFTRLVSAFIINAAKVAQKQGFTVSEAEAEADLLNLATISYNQLKGNPSIGAGTLEAYLREQLRRMHLDRKEAVAIWQQVMLFRRLFHGTGNAALVDTLAYKGFNEYAKSYVAGDLYRLPEELRLPTFEDLQKFELYLSAIGERPDSGKGLLEFPKKRFSPAEVQGKMGELVQKKYQLQIASVDMSDLASSIGIKEMWDWQLEDNHWKELQKEFPSLALVQSKNRDERFIALKVLDPMTRGKVDQWSREQMIKAHPEWLDEALANAIARDETVWMRKKGNNNVFLGLGDGKELMKLLDEAPLGQALEALAKYTPDQRHYYRIVVVDRDPKEEIITFAEAKKDGTLDRVLEKTLQKHYETIRVNKALDFQQADKSWKSLVEVKDKVAEDYFAPILKAIKDDYLAQVKSASKTVTSDQLAAYRFGAFMRKAQKELQSGTEESVYLTDQPWSLIKAPYKVVRSDPKANLLDKESLFSSDEQAWVGVSTTSHGDLVFFHITEKGVDTLQPAIVQGVEEAHELLSDAAQRVLMKKLLAKIQEKKAISLDYMGQKETVPETP